MNGEEPPRVVAIWLPIGVDGRLVGEGIWRVMKEIAIEHSSSSDARGFKLVFVVPAWVKEEIKEELDSVLGDTVSFYCIEPTTLPTLVLLSAVRRQRERTANRRIKRKLDFGRLQKWRNFWTARLSAWYLRPIYPALLPLLAGAARFTAKRERRTTSEIARSHFGGLTAAALDVEFSAMIRVAESAIRPDAWWVPFPQARGITQLRAPYAVHVHDLVYATHPKGSTIGSVVESKYLISDSVKSARMVFCGSDHVASEIVQGLFDVPAHRVRSVPHASPKLGKFLASECLADGIITRNSQTLSWAGKTIREYCESRKDNWPIVDLFSEEFIAPRAARFSYENEQFIFVATQNRPYKNTLAVLKAFRELVQTRQKNYYLILTCEVRFSDKSDLVARYLVTNNLVDRVIAIPRVPDSVLACLYFSAAVAVHPSIYEGGRGAFPFYEAMSVQCPALVADSLAMREAAEHIPAYKEVIFNPTNISELATRIDQTIHRRENALSSQSAIYASATEWTWRHCLNSYLDAFTEIIDSKK